MIALYAAFYMIIITNHGDLTAVPYQDGAQCDLVASRVTEQTGNYKAFCIEGNKR